MQQQQLVEWIKWTATNWSRSPLPTCVCVCVCVHLSTLLPGSSGLTWAHLRLPALTWPYLCVCWRFAFFAGAESAVAAFGATTTTTAEAELAAEKHATSVKLPPAAASVLASSIISRWCQIIVVVLVVYLKLQQAAADAIDHSTYGRQVSDLDSSLRW